MKVKVGLCGFGGLGHVHANTLCQMKDVDFVAVCDSRPSQLKAQDVKINIDTGATSFDISTCRTYTDYKEMLRTEKLDAIVTALPTDIHARVAIHALEQGCHVFSEKPMALNVKECDRMIAARDKANRELMIGQCLRFWSDYDVLLNAIRKRPYGKLLSLNMERIGSYSSWSDANWMNDHKRSGSAILDLHLHDVDWALYALGRPAGIFTGAIKGKTGGYDDITAVWDYVDGPMVTIRCSWMYTGFQMNFRAIFEKGIIEYGFPQDPALRVFKSGAKDWVKPSVKPGGAYQQEMQYFIECVQGKHRNDICTAESTRESIEMIHIESRSADRKRRLILKQ